MTWRIEPLNQSHSRDNFDCGDEALNRFIRQYARQQQTRGLNCSYVALPEAGQTVVGFYSLSAGSIAFSELDAALKLPRYPVPVARLGRLAVDRAWQQQGVGQALLAHAFKLIVVLSEQIGIYAAVVDAKHERAKAYYHQLGFIPCQDRTLTLYLPVATLRWGMIADSQSGKV
jgi:predicted N-acetyltransferase YhbS